MRLEMRARARASWGLTGRTGTKRRKGQLLCGAKTRAGGCCQVRAEPGKARCRFHGGKSTGPKTRAGRARIAEAQRLRWKYYRVKPRIRSIVRLVSEQISQICLSYTA